VIDGVTFYEGNGSTIRVRTTYTTNNTKYTGTAVCVYPPVDGGAKTATTDYSADTTTFTTFLDFFGTIIVSTYTKQ